MKRCHLIIIFCLIIGCTNHKSHKLNVDEVLVLPFQQKNLHLWGKVANDSTLKEIIMGKDNKYLENDFTQKSINSDEQSLRLSYHQVISFLPDSLKVDIEDYAKKLCVYLMAVKKLDRGNTLVVYLIENEFGSGNILASYHNGKIVDTMSFDVGLNRYSLSVSDNIERFQITNNECRFTKPNQFVYSCKNIVVEENRVTHERDTLTISQDSGIYMVDDVGHLNREPLTESSYSPK